MPNPNPFDFSSILQGFVKAPERVAKELAPWMQAVMSAAAVRWLPRLAMGMSSPCMVPKKPGEQHLCGAATVADCEACGRPTCVYHGAIDASAEMLCYVCIGKTIAREKGGEPKAPPERPDAAPPRRVGLPKEVKEAYELLGIPPSCSQEQLDELYKMLLKRHHPDRQHVPAKKELAEKRFKEVRVAYDTVMSWRKAAAA